MKRTAAVLMTLCLLCLSACGAPAKTEQTTESESISSVQVTEKDASQPLHFELEKLPDIGTRKQGATGGRFFAEYRDTFEPRSDYGSIVPYIGSVYYYTSNPYSGADEEESYNCYTTPQYRYGLMTGDGKIVVDDVYADVYFDEDAGACGVYCVTPFADRGAKSLHPEDAQTEEEYAKAAEKQPEDPDNWYISADGSWAFHVRYNQAVCFGKDRIAVYPAWQQYWIEDPQDWAVKVYDYSFRKIYEIPADPEGKDRQPSMVYCRMTTAGLLMDDVEFQEDAGRAVFFRDASGNALLEEYHNAKSCDLFGDSYVIETADGKFLLLDSNGRQKLASAYMEVIRLWETDYLVIEQEGEYLVMDTDLKQIGKPKSFKPYLNIVNGMEAYSDLDFNHEGRCWLLDTDAPIERQAYSDYARYIDGRYICIQSGDHDATLRDTTTAKDLVKVPHADAATFFANGELAYFFGLYGQKTHTDHVYSLKEQKMLFEKDTISYYENQGNTYLVYYGDGKSVVFNYTTGKTLYHKNIE